MKVKTIENMAVIALDCKVEDIEKVETYAPEAMILKDEDGNQTFKLIVDCCPYGVNLGGIADFMASFSIVGDKVLCWFGLPSDSVESKESKEEYIKKNYGVTLNNIIEVETQIKSVIANINHKIEEVGENIQHLA